jgi:4-hydroxybenzoate polyprenyltransferase
MLLAFLSTLFFLFHIRVIDESRDMELDSSLHPERPVQRGIISLKELFVTTLLGVAVCISIAVYAGLPATVITFLILIFTTFAWRDFFAKSFFANKPVLYHLVNSPQMILIQWNIYAIYTNSFQVTWLMLLQLLLVYNSIFILEIVRKVKTPTTDSADTYSANMGSGKSIAFASLMVVTGYGIFILLLNGLNTLNFQYLLAGALVSIFAVALMLVHGKIQSVLTEKIMVVGAVFYYVSMNLIVYLSSF